MELKPENGLVNMGNVILGESIEKSFKIQNISNFKFDFNVLPIAEGLRNNNRNEVIHKLNQKLCYLNFERPSFLSLPRAR